MYVNLVVRMTKIFFITFHTFCILFTDFLTKLKCEQVKYVITVPNNIEYLLFTK